MKMVFGIIDSADWKNRLFLKIISNVQNNILTSIEDSLTEFPSNGKAYVPFAVTNVSSGQLGFFVLNESENYNNDNPKSSKYVVSHEITNLNYFEVIQIDYAFSTQQKEISHMIQSGIKMSFGISSKVLLHTQDDYLIGPYSVKENNDDEWVGQIDDSGLVEVRQNNEHFIKYADAGSGVYRYFVSAGVTNSTTEIYLDCSTDDKVVREALKVLKEEKNAQELSRAVIKKLIDLVNDTPASVRKDRIAKAIQLLQSHSISDEDISRFNSELMQYDLVGLKINEKVEEKLIEEKIKLEEKHRKIINETKRFETKMEKLQVEVKTMEEQKKKIGKDVVKADDALQKKLIEMKENVYHTFLEMLPTQVNVDTSEPAESPLILVNSTWLVKENEQKEIFFNETVKLKNHLVENLKQIGIKKEAEFIALTVIGAIHFRKPLIIKGENCFDIAQTISWSMSGNDSITIFPELQGFSNKSLTDCFQSYERLDSIKTMHISSIENSAAELYLPSFVDYWTVSTNVFYPDLLMISIKDCEEISGDFFGKLKYAPVLDTENIGTKGKLRKARLQGDIRFAYTPSTILDESILMKQKSKYFTEFKELLEDIEGIRFSRISSEFKGWFCLFETEDFEEKDLIKWVVDILLQDYIKSEDFDGILKEILDIGELQGV